MSASPAEQTPGQTPKSPAQTPGQTSGQTPNGGLPPIMRRRKAADPLVQPRAKTRRVQVPTTTNGVAPSRQNGPSLLGQTQMKSLLQNPAKQPNPRVPRSLREPPDPVSGFTSAPIAQVTDYPLVMTKRSLLEGLRHHVARFASKKTVDPRNAQEFVRPVRLHRRDPRAPGPSAGVSKDGDTDLGAVDPKAALDDKEIQRQEILKAEREAQREVEMAQVAPSVNIGGQKKMNAFNKKKTQQVYRNDQTDEQRAESKLRYEEALPWHLEDFEGKNSWVGSYEAALSDTYAILVHGQDGKFRMVPLEKWYKFTPKNKFKTLTIEEAEARMKKSVKDPRWFMQSQQERKEMQSEQENKRAARGLYLGKWERGAGGSATTAPRAKQEQADADDMDFQEDQFADDEVDVFMEGEDMETKQAEERIRRDQLQANVFDLKEEKEYELAELAEKKEREAEKKLGKGVKKALMKREKNFVYDSDSNDNPYSEESESEDTDVERLKEEERKKEEEKKSDLDKAGASKPPSGSSTKGNNTPSQRPVKTPDTPKKTTTNKLKRSGSPNLSEASGAESTRKKMKKQHGQAQTLQPSSRPTSPPPPSSSAVTENSSARPTLANARKHSASRLAPNAAQTKSPRSPLRDPRSPAGSGSEKSEDEKSDGARERIKLKFTTKKRTDLNDGVPSAPISRAGSPDAGNSVPGQESGARNHAGGYDDPNTAPFPTAAELRARIPITGLKVGQLLACFPGQVVGEERKQRFTKLMRENTRYDKPRKLLLPL